MIFEGTGPILQRSGEESTPASPPAPPGWRTLAVTTRTWEVLRVDGPTIDVHAVVVQLRWAHQAGRPPYQRGGVTDEGVALAAPDLVLWVDDRVVGLVRALADGHLDVVRYPEVGRLVAMAGKDGGR